MPSCRDVAGRATAFLDGDLSVGATVRMRLHLAMCKGCRAFVGQMRIANGLTATAARREANDPRLAAGAAALLDGRAGAAIPGDRS